MAIAPAFAQNVKDLEKKAKDGDAGAMIELGDCYFNGTGTGKDAKKAKDWYEKAAKAGNNEAYPKLVACYSSWDGIEKNQKKAFEWMKKGAEAGNAQMHFEMAKAYESGEGIEQNNHAAAIEYVEAAYGGIDEAVEPAIKSALATGNKLDAFSMAYAAANSDDASPELKALAKNVMGLVMLGINYESAANQFFTADTTPELEFAKLKVKTATTGKFDAPAFEKIMADKPDDDAEANFYRGIIALSDSRWPQAADLFAKSAQKGYDNSRIALFILAMPQEVCANLARNESCFNDDPMISVILNIMKTPSRNQTLSLLHKAGLPQMSNINYSSVESSVAKHNADPLNFDKKNLQNEKNNYTIDEYLKALGKTDPRGTLLYWYMKGTSHGQLNIVHQLLLENHSFFSDMQRVADTGMPMAANLVQAVINAEAAAIQNQRRGQVQQDYVDKAKKKVSIMRAKTSTTKLNKLLDFIPACRQSIVEYNNAANNSDKAKATVRFNGTFHVVDQYMNPVPAKLNLVLQIGNDEYTKKVFEEAATKFPQFVLQWAEENHYSVDVITSDLSLPELLEMAGKNATGETRQKIAKALKDRYGRSI